MTAVACPVALHPDGAPRRIAMYLDAGSLLHAVREPLTPNALPQAIAARTLYDQSGLETRAALPFGTSDSIEQNILWHFTLCRIVPPVRNHWKHPAPDGSGLLQFYWICIDGPAPYPVSGSTRNVLAWLQATL